MDTVVTNILSATKFSKFLLAKELKQNRVSETKNLFALIMHFLLYSQELIKPILFPPQVKYGHLHIAIITNTTCITTTVFSTQKISLKSQLSEKQYFDHESLLFPLKFL